MKIYILTSEEHKNIFHDDKNLIEVMKDRSIEPIISIWDKDIIPDGSTVLIRTIWDYAEKAMKFKNLLNDFKKRGIRLLNDIDTVLWNMDKSYLVELFEKDIPVVPTSISQNFSLKSLEESKITYPLVVKPLVGASGIDTFCLENSEHGKDISNLYNREVIIQPFMKSILDEGEISFIYFGGKYSHSVIKTAKSGEFRIQEGHGGSVNAYLPSQEELSLVEDILGKINRKWDYARVDVVRSEGKFLIMELELIEPELFFRFSKEGEVALVNHLAATYLE